MINNNDKAYIFLSSLELSYKKFSDVISHYSSAGDVITAFQNSDEFLQKTFDKKFEEYENKFIHYSFETFDEYLQNKNMHYITIESEQYPQNLMQLDQPPLILFYKGDLSLVNSNCFAIVGTRKPSFYGRDTTAKYAKVLAKSNITIVSGLAVGVDKIAHESTLLEKGKTIAVLGNGLDTIYPSLNTNLANDIISGGGLVITEYYPTFKACTYSFPARNRIIAALSKGILITEAAKKSGSLYTKDFALDLGRDVFCVPGNITSVNCEGTNNLIKCGHAQCTTDPKDILDYYGIEDKSKKAVRVQLDFEQQKVFDFLKNGEKTFDEIQIYTNFSVQNLNTCLTTLQISGIIKKLPGNYYSV